MLRFGLSALRNTASIRVLRTTLPAQQTIRSFSDDQADYDSTDCDNTYYNPTTDSKTNDTKQSSDSWTGSWLRRSDNKPDSTHNTPVFLTPQNAQIKTPTGARNTEQKAGILTFISKTLFGAGTVDVAPTANKDKPQPKI